MRGDADLRRSAWPFTQPSPASGAGRIDPGHLLPQGEKGMMAAR
jgi:hypothetical protein